MIMFLCACENTYIAYHNAKDENTIEAYENFIKEYPKSKYVDSANAEITFLTTGFYPVVEEEVIAVEDTLATDEELTAWELVSADDDKTSYEDFITLYPEGYYTDSANIILYYTDKSVIFTFESDSNGVFVEILNLTFGENDEITGTFEGSLEADDATVSWSGEITGIREGMWLVLSFTVSEYDGDDELADTERYYLLGEGGIYFDEDFYEISSEISNDIVVSEG